MGGREEAAAGGEEGGLSGLDPSIPPWRREAGDTTNSRAIIGACRPYHWRDAYPRLNALSVAEQREARRKFGWLLDGGAAPDDEAKDRE